jgi:hypothetical protein
VARSGHAGRVRLARMAVVGIALAILATYAAISVWAILNHWYFYDARGYWDAGVRLHEGLPLYPAVIDQDDPAVYRYAPWFAWLWWLLALLPEGPVLVGWGVLMAAACIYLLWLMPRSWTGIALALLFGPMLLRVLSQGNVHPLMIAALAFGLPRRSGPMWIGLSASLKLVPILFALVYVANREYRRAGVAILLAVVLWLPAVAYGLDAYPLQVGGESFPFGPITFVVAGLAVIAVFAAPARFRVLAAAVAATFASPRWIPYNPTYLIISMRARMPSEARAVSQPDPHAAGAQSVRGDPP